MGCGASAAPAAESQSDDPQAPRAPSKEPAPPTTEPPPVAEPGSAEVLPAAQDAPEVGPATERPAAEPSAEPASETEPLGGHPVGRGNRKDGHQHAARAKARAKRLAWKQADPSKWTFPEVEVNGSYSYHQEPTIEEISAPISKGIQELKENPECSDGLFYQSNMVEWPEDQQKYNIVKRTGSGLQFKPEPGGGFTWVQAKYVALTPDVEIVPDAYTDSMNYGGCALPEPRLPGRGMGCNDVPSIKLIDSAHPRDVSQGGVGDCWLLCAMSAIAEYKGVVSSLFKNTPDFANRPLETWNQYSITLYDLSTPEWQPVDVVVDERLCSKPDDSSLLGAQPSFTGELWVCYLEKAIAAHCGGWDEINGGTCTHAWRLLLGCRNVYTFKLKEESFSCFGTFNPNTGEWEELANSPHKGFQGLWPMAWPEKGGGGDLDLKLSKDDFFNRLVHWDDADFIMACGSSDGDDNTHVEGIVQGHAYTLLECLHNPGGVEVDLVKLRNPWGKGEFTAGKWTDDGAGWGEHPEVKAVCNPSDHDDGVFWMEKDELFEYFSTIYLCALDMSTLQ